MEHHQEGSYVHPIWKLLQNEHPTLNYKMVSLLLNVSVETAKKMLMNFLEFAKQHEKFVHATYYLSGLLRETGRGKYIDKLTAGEQMVCVCKEDDLNAVKLLYSCIFSIHVYSVSVSPLQSMEDLAKLLNFPKTNSEGNTIIEYAVSSKSVLNPTSSLGTFSNSASTIPNDPLPTSIPKDAMARVAGAALPTPKQTFPLFDKKPSLTGPSGAKRHSSSTYFFAKNRRMPNPKGTNPKAIKLKGLKELKKQSTILSKQGAKDSAEGLLNAPQSCPPDTVSNETFEEPKRENVQYPSREARVMTTSTAANQPKQTSLLAFFKKLDKST